MCRKLDSKGRFAKRFIRQGVCFQPPTPLTLSLEGDSLNYEVELPVLVLVPFVWDMEDMYGASKRPCQFLGVVDTIKLDDFIRDSIPIVICSNRGFCSNLHLS
jgi:hypothetical protein